MIEAGSQIQSETAMPFSETLMLLAIGAIVAVAWISLIRASVCRGCRSGSCQPDKEEQRSRRTIDRTAGRVLG